MAKSSVKWGLVGSTSWADTTFGPAIVGAENATLHAVLSSGQDTADAFCAKHEVPKGYADLAAFLADRDVQAVWIASPNHLHAQQAIAALKAGKHVLVEKPMAITTAECESMIAAAEQAKRVLGVGYHLRHHPLHQEVHSEWTSGKFGQPIFFRAQLYFPYPTLPPPWRQKKNLCGGWALGDIGTHLIDLATWFMGEATGVQGILTNRRFGLETEDHAALLIRFKSGASALCDASTGAAGPARFEMYGTEGYCICENTYFGKGGLITRGRPNDQPHISGGHNVSPYKKQVESFSRAVLGEEEFPVPAKIGLENVRIMQAARGY